MSKKNVNYSSSAITVYKLYLKISQDISDKFYNFQNEFRTYQVTYRILAITDSTNLPGCTSGYYIYYLG